MPSAGVSRSNTIDGRAAIRRTSVRLVMRNTLQIGAPSCTEKAGIADSSLDGVLFDQIPAVKPGWASAAELRARSRAVSAARGRRFDLCQGQDPEPPVQTRLAVE